MDEASVFIKTKNLSYKKNVMQTLIYSLLIIMSLSLQALIKNCNLCFLIKQMHLIQVKRNLDRITGFCS